MSVYGVDDVPVILMFRVVVSLFVIVVCGQVVVYVNDV